MQHAIANELNGSLRWIRGGENQMLRKRNETKPPLIPSLPAAEESWRKKTVFTEALLVWTSSIFVDANATE